eukprot:3938864-Rhodomonas_salina.1
MLGRFQHRLREDGVSAIRAQGVDAENCGRALASHARPQLVLPPLTGAALRGRVGVQEHLDSQHVRQLEVAAQVCGGQREVRRERAQEVAGDEGGVTVQLLNRH